MKKSKKYMKNIRKEIRRQVIDNTNQLYGIPNEAKKASKDLCKYIEGIVNDTDALSNVNLTPSLQYAYYNLLDVIQKHTGIANISPENIREIWEDAACELADISVKLAEKMVTFIKLDAMLKITEMKKPQLYNEESYRKTNK